MLTETIVITGRPFVIRFLQVKGVFRLKRKKVAGLIFYLIVMVVIFFIINFVVDNPYIGWFLNSKYSITSATIEQDMQEDGSVLVHEIINFRMRKPFKGLYRNIPEGRYVRMDDFEIWTDGLPVQRVVTQDRTDRSFSAQIWIAPYNSTTSIKPDETNRDITLHIKYKAYYVLENGKDISYLSRVFWGDQWDSPVGKLTGKFTFPDTLGILDVYNHPKGQIEMLDNGFIITQENLPPNAMADAIVVFDKASGIRYAANNSNIDRTLVDEEEADDKRAISTRLLTPFIGYGVIIALIVLIYFAMGREPHIDYQGLYERDLPYDDSPDLVNAIVRMSNTPNKDGMASIIMSLYRKDYIDFTDDKKILLNAANGDKKLYPTEEAFYELLRKYAENGVFDFEGLAKKFKKSVSKAKQFTEDMRRYETKVSSLVKSKKFLFSGGDSLSKLLAIIMMSLAIWFIKWIPSTAGTQQLLNFATISAVVYWMTGAVILYLPKDIFGRWSKTGREYYLKWRNFEKFLTDYSLLSTYPPESIVLWEEYLVYATALGIADQVRKSLNKMIPEEIWREQSNHAYFVNPYGIALGYQMSTLKTTAVAATSSSSSSGFGGGGGGAGGGSGGGGGGAF